MKSFKEFLKETKVSSVDVERVLMLNNIRYMRRDSMDGIKWKLPMGYTLLLSNDMKVSLSRGNKEEFSGDVKDLNSALKSASLVEQTLDEVLDKEDPIEDWIKDFIESDNPKFEGKSKEKRIEMAKAAYYAAQEK